MSEPKYRIIVTKVNNPRQEIEATDCHTAKSVAGTLFHVNTVVSVCVADISGFVYLYLNKHRGVDKWVNVPSALAQFD